MIVGIEGEIELKEPTYLHINVAGVIYKVNVSLNCSSTIDSDRIKLLITQIIREDSNTLYGFVSEDEKKIFDRLIKINGVGPRVALAICSSFTPEIFADIVNSKNSSMLKKVPGIGVKSANRILMELSDFTIESNSSSRSNIEAVMALESLGFKKEMILKALLNESGDTSTLIKKTLKKLSKV
jgi:Holliday junction DNA helicase RuvA